MSYFSRYLKDSSAENNVGRESSRGFKREQYQQRNITRDYSCGILEKNMAAFYPCLKNLPEVKLRSFRLIPLEKVISRQPSTD